MEYLNGSTNQFVVMLSVILDYGIRVVRLYGFSNLDYAWDYAKRNQSQTIMVLGPIGNVIWDETISPLD